jgi:hypothetical protein
MWTKIKKGGLRQGFIKKYYTALDKTYLRDFAASFRSLKKEAKSPND